MSHVPDYEAKYQQKLLERARQEGVETVEELKQKILERQQQPAAKPSGSKATSSAQIKSTKSTTNRQQKQRVSQNLPPGVKSLDQVMKVELLENKTAEEIGEIWTTYHATKDTVSAAIPAETYQRLLQVARKNPLFVLPLPREGQGVEFYFMQFDFHQVHFTSLLEYKTNQAQARPYLTLTHYTDFMDRGIVLMRGELDSERNLLDVPNAQYLALQMQQFYITGGDEKRRLVEAFNHHPDQFDYRQLIDAAQKI
ncbi:ATP11 protein-domain-containing protein [Coemansia mojavensis]|nr:ATP11 protein-domain-containing protein [Coemansia mojavensis]